MDAFLGEIKIWPVPRCPDGWRFCDGSSLTINGNEALFSILGARYGGDGTTKFNLPDLRGRVPVHMGTGPGTNGTLPATNRVIGQSGGAQTVTLTQAQMPVHEHQVFGSGVAASTDTPGPTVMLGTTSSGVYAYMKESAVGKDFTFNAATLATSGGSQPHNNMMPSRTLNYIICVQGTYPVKP